jgi:hypothetical protein
MLVTRVETFQGCDIRAIPTLSPHRLRHDVWDALLWLHAEHRHGALSVNLVDCPTLRFLLRHKDALEHDMNRRRRLPVAQQVIRFDEGEAVDVMPGPAGRRDDQTVEVSPEFVAVDAGTGLFSPGATLFNPLAAMTACITS